MLASVLARLLIMWRHLNSILVLSFAISVAAKDAPVQASGHTDAGECRAYLKGLLPPDSSLPSFDEDADAGLPTLTFLDIDAESPLHVLESNGFELVEYHGQEEDPGGTIPWPTSVKHSPESGTVHARCATNTLSELPWPPSSWAIASTRNASATFEGFAITTRGAVFSARADVTRHLLREMLKPRLHQAYRLSNKCGRFAAGVVPCCVSVNTSGSPLQPLVSFSGKPGDISWRDSAFYDEINVFAGHLQQCNGTRGDLTTEELMLFQAMYSNSFFHFVAESLPRLLQIVTFLRSRPSVQIFFSGASPAKPFVSDILLTLGLLDRVVPFDPCKSTRADHMYVMLMSGRPLPSQKLTHVTHTFLAQLGHPTPADTMSASPYILLIDRSDGTAMLTSNGAQAVPRALTNIDDAKSAIEASLSNVSAGIDLRVLRLAGMPLAEQVSLVAPARMLIGVHGAGLTHLLSLSSSSALLEIVPANKLIRHRLRTRKLDSRCGFTDYYFLAALRGIPYHALLLHDSDWDGEIHVPTNVLAAYTLQILGLSIAHAPLNADTPSQENHKAREKRISDTLPKFIGAASHALKMKITPAAARRAMRAHADAKGDFADKTAMFDAFSYLQKELAEGEL